MEQLNIFQRLDNKINNFRENSSTYPHVILLGEFEKDELHTGLELARYFSAPSNRNPVNLIGGYIGAYKEIPLFEVNAEFCLEIF